MSEEGRYKVVIELHDTVREELDILESITTLDTDDLEKAIKEWTCIVDFVYCQMEGEEE